MHWVNHRESLREWTAKLFVGNCITRRTVRSGVSMGTSVHVVSRFLGSLRSMDLALHHPYSDREKAIMFPATEWDLLEPGRNNHSDSHSLY
jgi:hypothetical protein